MPNEPENGEWYSVQYSLSDYIFPTQARAARLSFDETYMHIHLTDGRIVSVPLAWIPTLYHASPADREKWHIGERGLVLTWLPWEGSINEDILVASWLAGGIDPDDEPVQAENESAFQEG